MADFIVTSVRLSATPVAFTLDIQLAIDAGGQCAGLRAHLVRESRISLAVKQRRHKAHAAYIPGIHSCHLVKISADHFKQVLDIAIIRQPITRLIELLPIKSMANTMVEHGLSIDLRIQPGKVASYPQIVLRTPQYRHIIYCIPRADGLPRYVIG